MKLADNQDPPTNPFAGKATQGIIKKDGTVNALVSAELAYTQAQKDMLTPKDGMVFKKVIIRGEKDETQIR